MASSRKTVRQALATAMEAAFVPDEVQALYGYKVRTWEQQSPVIVLTSNGTARGQMTLRGSRASYFFNVWLFVFEGDEAGDEADAENTLDDLEQAVRAWIDANQHSESGGWRSIAIEPRTTVDAIIEGGEGYRRELIPIRVEVYG